MTDIDLSALAADRDGSQPLRGYLSTPSGPGPWPGVVTIHEIFGLDDVMRRHADHLAGLGYLTLAVDLFQLGRHRAVSGFHHDRHDGRARPRVRRHRRDPSCRRRIAPPPARRHYPPRSSYLELSRRARELDPL